MVSLGVDSDFGRTWGEVTDSHGSKALGAPAQSLIATNQRKAWFCSIATHHNLWGESCRIDIAYMGGGRVLCTSEHAWRRQLSALVMCPLSISVANMGCVIISVASSTVTVPPTSRSLHGLAHSRASWRPRPAQRQRTGCTTQPRPRWHTCQLFRLIHSNGKGGVLRPAQQ